jgi:D-galactarolactone cycloisomerase
MKIRGIYAAGLSGQTPAGGWTVELQPTDVVHTLVVVVTDEDVVGVGSVFTSDALVRAALSVLEPLYAGENALEPDRVTEKLHQNTFWMGRGGSLTHTISGINVALWDIQGRVLGQPVGRLLGGRYRSRVLPYASLLIEPDLDLLKDNLKSLLQQGFRAFKIGWGSFGRRGFAFDEAVVRTAREAVGERIPLAVDAGGSDAYWAGDFKWAMRTAEMLARYDVAWFEEPLRPDALTDFVALRRTVPLPISGGETLTRRQSFVPFLAQGALDIVQPDTTKVGGLSEARRIGWLAEENGIRLIPHGWNTAVGLAADLQLASALADTNMVEYKTGSPYIDAIVAPGTWTLDADGMLAIPDKPGLGIELDPDGLEKYTGSRSLPVT